MIYTLLTHGLTVILSLLCILILPIIVGQIIQIIFNFLSVKKGIIGLSYDFGGPTLLKVNRFLPIHVGHFLISLSSNILYLPVILFLYQYVIDCIYVFDIIFMYSLIILHILKIVIIFFKGGTIKTINSEEWIEEKSMGIGEIIGIIIAFYFFGGKLAEAMCFSSI